MLRLREGRRRTLIELPPSNRVQSHNLLTSFFGFRFSIELDFVPNGPKQVSKSAERHILFAAEALRHKSFGLTHPSRKVSLGNADLVHRRSQQLGSFEDQFLLSEELLVDVEKILRSNHIGSLSQTGLSSKFRIGF